ncbi:uncharacterized protein L201_006837 [Kwoniella dendrophila CBS 6074]|uniref:Peptidase A1 domain-containing protein n=1 Tax=Kwoniella dendrophila CBS 6074 TaxID=1295534 RepID=A0AAX4K567_9TREE
MVTTQHFLAVFSLLSITLTTAILPQNEGFIPRLPSSQGSLQAIHGRHARTAQAHKRVPSVGISGINIDLHESLISRGVNLAGKEKRAVDVNGTEVNLGSAQNTFVVPVSIGSPPSIYPLQLDLASSDLLVASTLCTTNSCPTSLGPNVNAYYDISKGSTGFEAVNGNQTYWNSSYADGTVASGIIVRETVTLGEVVLQGQIMGFINSTNLTLSQQKISGILGLGFPRLSALSHILLESEHENSSSNPISSSSPPSSAPSSASASSSGSSSISKATPTYYPPILENLVRTPHIPYPVFALALAPPHSNASATSSSSSATSTSTSRYQFKIGSLTLGGVSNHYISDKVGSGRTIDDIEWHDVIPFGKAKSFSNDSSGALSRTMTVSSSPTATSAPASSSSQSATSSTLSSGNSRKRSTENQLNKSPSDLNELGEEEYLFWALELKNLSLNGTDIPLNSSYEKIGLPSIALLDIGFNGISGPQQDVIRLFNKIPDARQVSEGQWVVPCNTRMTIGFSFGGRYVQLQPSDWISTQIDSSSFCLAWPIAAPSTGDGMDWQLGTPFLKKVYSIFSYGINGVQAPLVGFLPLEDDPSLTTSSISGSSSPSASSTTATTAFDPNSPTPTTISDLSLTTTIKTILPNQLIPDPTYTTPTYVYSTVLPPGQTQYLGLANSSVYTVDKVPIISLDSAATSRIASMAGGGQQGGSAAGSGATSDASQLVSAGSLGLLFAFVSMSTILSVAY